MHFQTEMAPSFAGRGNNGPAAGAVIPGYRAAASGAVIPGYRTVTAGAEKVISLLAGFLQAALFPGRTVFYEKHPRSAAGSRELQGDEASANGGGKIIAFRGKSSRDAARVFDTWGNSILRLAYTYLHGMEDAEDILQEVLIRYMQKAPEFEDPMHEKAWLLKVTANLSKNRIRSNRIRQADELTEMFAEEEKEDLSFVWEAVSSLPDRQREVIHLFYQEGFQTAEIAGILQMNESTVRSDLKRGRERLKKILKEAYDFE